MVTVEVRGARAVIQLLIGSRDRVTRGVTNGLREIAKAVTKKSQDYAPRSPTRAQVTATLKVKRRSTAQCNPGGLEKSIKWEVVTDGSGTCAKVFVASNAPAGAYAKRIHDLKGIKWWNRGIGTRAKGDQADEKFIERAIADLKSQFAPVMRNEMRKALAV